MLELQRGDLVERQLMQLHTSEIKPLEDDSIFLQDIKVAENQTQPQMFDDHSMNDIIEDLGAGRVRSVDQRREEAKGDEGVLKHIKGTLLQFLRQCPVTDKNNEELLSILLSMMECSQQEIQEVHSYRRNGKRANSVSSGGAPVGGGTDPNEEDVRKKTSKGIFGLFRKGSRDKRTEGSAQDLSAGSLTSPMRPIPQPVRRL